MVSRRRASGTSALAATTAATAPSGPTPAVTPSCLAAQGLARVASSTAITLEAGVGLGANPIYTYGSDEQRGRWLPDLCAGQALAAFGLTEPDGGSDAGATRTRAKIDEATGDWVIDGSKAFITNSGTPITSVITVTARTGGPGDSEISALMIPTRTPGLILEPPYRKMGWHASDTHGLSLQDCRLPEPNLLGSRRAGPALF